MQDLYNFEDNSSLQTGDFNHYLLMRQLSMRNSWFKFKNLGKSSIILEESKDYIFV